MKIDYLAPFKDVFRLVQAPRQEDTPVSNKLTLGQLSGAGEKAAVRSESSHPNFEQIKDELDKGPMAQMAFAAPTTREPGLPQIELDLESTDVTEGGGLSTPKILDARRAPSAEDLASLPRAKRITAVEELVRDAGRRIGIDPLLGMAVVSAESSFNPLAVSSDGHASKGLFQLLDTTGKERHSIAAVDKPYDPFEPAQNVELGINYLRHLHQIFSQPTELNNKLSTVPAANSSSLEKLAVAAFNAGEGRVASAQSRAQRSGGNPAEYADVEGYLPNSTQEYVRRVALFKDQFESRFIDTPLG